MVSSFTVSSCPCGQAAGADDSFIGRLTSKVSPQARQRNSYRGMTREYGRGAKAGGGIILVRFDAEAGNATYSTRGERRGTVDL